ncbi:Photosystem I reaction center subunit VI, chloroplastic [Glycine soja]
MASLASLVVVQPSTVKGLAGSSLAGTKLSFKPSRQSFRPKNFRYDHSYVVEQRVEWLESVCLGNWLAVFYKTFLFCLQVELLKATVNQCQLPRSFSSILVTFLLLDLIDIRQFAAGGQDVYVQIDASELDFSIKSNQNNGVQVDDMDLLVFDLSTIAKTTSNFTVKNKIGEGGFGLVYRMVRDPLPGFVGMSRLYPALVCFISCLHWKQDILHFLE